MVAGRRRIVCLHRVEDECQDITPLTVRSDRMCLRNHGGVGALFQSGGHVYLTAGPGSLAVARSAVDRVGFESRP
jgi:hypothetical protein